MNVNRRQFLRRAATVTAGAGVLTGYYTWQVEPHWLEVTERDLPLRGLPEALEGKRLVQISDLHVGRTVNPQYLRRAIEQVASLQPDLVVLTGDLMTCRFGEQIEPVVELLRHLQLDQRPLFVTAGNHDYGLGCAQQNVCDQLMQKLRNIGATPLANQQADYEGLQIVGLDDLWGRRFDLQAGLDRFDSTRDGIVLSHNPDTVDQPGWERFHGWVLSGHTHGGQCWAPFIGAPIVPVRNRRYTSGAVDLGGHRQLYVNRGIGYSRSVRFLCPPEITHFRLTRAEV